MKSRVILIATAFVLMLGLSVLTNHVIVSGIASIVLVTAVYFLTHHLIGKKRLSILDVECDPEKFLEVTELQREHTSKSPTVLAYLDIDRAAGLILLGRAEEGRDVLLNIDLQNVTRRKQIELIYAVDLMTAYYILGDIEKAESLYHSVVLSKEMENSKFKLTRALAEAERFYYIGEFAKSEKALKALLSKRMPPRIRLEILFLLAQIEESDGRYESAMKKYVVIADRGNKLAIADIAREKINKNQPKSKSTQKWKSVLA